MHDVFPHQLLESSYLRAPFRSGAAIGAAIVATPFLERNDDLMSIQTHTLEDTKHLMERFYNKVYTLED